LWEVRDMANQEKEHLAELKDRIAKLGEHL